MWGRGGSIKRSNRGGTKRGTTTGPPPPYLRNATSGILPSSCREIQQRLGLGGGPHFDGGGARSPPVCRMGSQFGGVHQFGREVSQFEGRVHHFGGGSQFDGAVTQFGG